MWSIALIAVILASVVVLVVLQKPQCLYDLRSLCGKVCDRMTGERATVRSVALLP
mgnify:CR=1 FL=1